MVVDTSYGAFKACRVVNACGALILDIDLDRMHMLDVFASSHKARRPWLWLTNCEKVKRKLPMALQDLAAEYRKWERKKARALLNLAEALSNEDRRLKVTICTEDFQLISDYYDEGEKL